MRIPLGNLGNRPVEYVGGPRPQSGDRVGAAASQLGASITHTAATLIDRDEREQEFARREAEQAAKEFQRERVKEAKEAASAREAADKANASSGLSLARESLEGLQQQFDEDLATGALDKRQAIELFRKRSQELMTSTLKDIPDAHKQSVSTGLLVRASSLEGKVQRSVTKRDRSETLAGLETTLEAAQRMAIKDEAGAMKMADEALTNLGPPAGLLPDALAKRRQSFMEGVAYTRAFTAINLSKNDNRALKQADAFIAKDTRLDPQKQAQLLTTSAGFQAANAQQAEAAASRAQRSQEAHLKRAEASANAFQMLSDKGGMIDPVEVEKAARATAGTPYAAVIKAAAQQAVATGGLAIQPIDVQRQALREVDADIAKNGRSAERDARRTQVAKVLSASETDSKKDALAAYQERGGGVPDRIDLSSPQALSASIAGRVAYAQRASQWTKKPESPLMEDEADQLMQLLTKLPPKQRADAVAVLARSIPAPQAMALGRQMGGKSRTLEHAFASSAAWSETAGTVTQNSTSEGRWVSELMFKGEQAQKDGTSTRNEKVPGNKALTWKAKVATELEGMFPAQTLTDAAKESALLIIHGMAAEQGSTIDDKDIERAVGMAVGGKIGEVNGKRIPLPAGIEADAVATRLRTITPAEVQAQAGPVVRAGGVEIPTADFAKKLPGAELAPYGRGQYMVIVQGRPVVSPNGRPVLIGVK